MRTDSLAKIFWAAVGALGVFGWESIRSARPDLPKWLGPLIVIAMVGVFALVRVIWRTNQNKLTDDEKYLLGHMLANNSIMVLQVGGKPRHVQAGMTSFYGRDETPQGFAPIAARYLAAFGALECRNCVERIGGYSQLSRLGGEVATSLPEQYRSKPPDIV